MKVFYLATIDFYRKPNPSFHLMSSMISDIMKENEVYYVGVEEKGLEKHIPDEFQNNQKFHYKLVKLTPVKRSNFVMRYLKGIWYALKAMKKIKWGIRSSDVIFISSSPTAMYNTLVAKCFSGKRKIVLNIQDMFPGSSIASGIMPKKWMQNIFYSLQKIAYKNADIIVAISDDMKTKLMEQGVPEDKIRVILNWYDDKSVHEVLWEENRFVKKYSMQQEMFYVQYAGTMGYVFDYRMVLNVASKMINMSDIVFQMIGMGSQKDAFVKAAVDANLTNIVFLPLEPQEMVSDVYSACSVCLIPLKKNVIGNSVPSKAGLLMACKRPIITSVDKNCLYAKEINDNKIGIACPEDNPDSVVDAIMKLYNNRKLSEEMGVNGYNYGHDIYSRTRNVKQYIDLFSELSFNIQ